MALVISGPLVIATASSQPAVRAFGELKSCAAMVLNAENQPKILDLAGHWILKGIDDINIRHLFRFGSKQAAAQTIVAGTKTYSLAADFFAIQEVQLLNADSNTHSTLEYIPWGQFNVLEQAQTATGQPMYWTARNTFDDSTIQVYPTPDASTAADYTLLLTYFERIDKPSSDSDVIDAPRELGDILCTYAEYGLLFTRDRQNVAAWGHKYRHYHDKLTQFMRATEREPTEEAQFRVHWVDNSGTSSKTDPLR